MWQLARCHILQSESLFGFRRLCQGEFSAGWLKPKPQELRLVPIKSPLNFLTSYSDVLLKHPDNLYLKGGQSIKAWPGCAEGNAQLTNWGQLSALTSRVSLQRVLLPVTSAHRPHSPHSQFPWFYSQAQLRVDKFGSAVSSDESFQGVFHQSSNICVFKGVAAFLKPSEKKNNKQLLLGHKDSLSTAKQA